MAEVLLGTAVGVEAASKDLNANTKSIKRGFSESHSTDETHRVNE